VVQYPQHIVALYCRQFLAKYFSYNALIDLATGQWAYPYCALRHVW
jgi:hypothetical protein